MARRWKRVAGTTVLIIVALLLVGITFTVGWRPFIGPRTRALTNRTFEATPARLERGREVRDEVEWRTDRLADAPWQALGPGRSARLAELAGPLLGAAFESGLLPAQSTLGIATVPSPAPRP